MVQSETAKNGFFDEHWVQKYRPKSIDDVVASDETIQLLRDIESSHSFSNILLLGVQGCGKTTIAKLIPDVICPSQRIFIAASEENGIDTIRTKVRGFIETKAIGKLKVVILDEACGLSPQAQLALKTLTEEYQGHARFILTGNTSGKIIEPLQSRCVSVNVNPPMDKIAARLIKILKTEGISYKDSIHELAEMVRENHPDIRRMIHILQVSSTTMTLNIAKGVIVQDDFISEVFGRITGDTVSLRRYIIENEESFGADYPKLLKTFFEYAFKQRVKNLDAVLLIVANHIEISNIVVDQEINAFACFIKLKEQLN